MTWARGTHESPQGTISVHWQTDGDQFRIIADIPAATTARITFPDGTVHEAGPGRFDQTAGLPASLITASAAR
ncbi:hypothetical protein D3C87_1787790 [compost metagenome]